VKAAILYVCTDGERLPMKDKLEKEAAIKYLAEKRQDAERQWATGEMPSVTTHVISIMLSVEISCHISFLEYDVTSAITLASVRYG